MKKVALLLCLLLFLCTPITAFAADTDSAGGQWSLPENPPQWEDREKPTDIKDYLDKLLEGSGTSDSASVIKPSANGAYSPSALTASTASTTKYTRSLKRYDGDFYNTEFTYTPSVSGFYYFADLDTSKWDSNIYITDATGKEVAYDSSIGQSFYLLAYLNAGYKYKIMMDSYKTKSLSYIMTTPCALGNTAVSAKNSYSYDWFQDFIFTVPASQLCSFNISNPSNSEFAAFIMTSDYEPLYYYEGSSETFDFDVFTKGTYHLILYMANYTSMSGAFTVAMDTEGNKTMSSGVPLNTTLTSGDILTTGLFGAASTGGYKFTCSRGDARLTLYDIDDETYVLRKSAANTTVNLTEGHGYIVLLSTDGSPGSMTYSVTYLSPDSTLSGIDASAGALSPAFSSSTTGYALVVDSDAASSVTITPKPTAVGGTMIIDGWVQASKTYSVNADTNQTITIEYTSPNGSNTSTYYVNMRAISKACQVREAYNGLNFDDYVLYNNVNSSKASQTVNVKVSANATWALYSNIACTELISGGVMTLEGGLNRAYVKVTAEDGYTSAVYPVLVYRAASTDPVIVAFNSSRQEISSGTYSKSTVIVKLMGSEYVTGSYTKDGVTNSWSSSIFTADGAYAVSVTDADEKTASFNFTIDKTMPVIAATDSSNGVVSHNGLTNKSVTVAVSDTNLSAKSVNKDSGAISWPANNTFTADGVYMISASDRAGNAAALSFTIDKTAPVITAAIGSTYLANDVYVNGNVVVTVSDARLSGKSVTKNGSAMSWPSNNTFTEAATYVISANDTASNASTFKFTIDKTLPAISAKSGGKAIKNGATTKKDVVLTVAEANVGAQTVTRNGAAFAWPANNVFTTEGAYIARVSDRSGNSVTFAFNIDKPPVLSVKTTTTGRTISNKGLTNESVVLSLTESFIKSRTIKRSGKTVAWPTDGVLSADGKYTVSVKDKSGSSLSFSFTIDRTPPAVTVKTKAKKILPNGGATNEATVTATVSDASKFTKSVTKDGVSLKFPSKFTAEGTYIITATDAAGNKATFKFVIDRVAPVISAKTPSGAVSNNATVNQDVVIAVTDRAAVTPTLTKNGAAEAWPSNNTVTADGTYVVTAKDSLGYAAAAFTFTIDKTAPVITAKDSSNAAVANKGVTNKDVTVTVTGQSGAVTATKNGSAFAYPTGGVFSAEGTYVVSASDAVGNKSTLTFTIDKTAPVITAKDGTNATVADGGSSETDVTVAVSGNSSAPTASKDGADFAYPAGGVFTQEGVYVITASDAVGNSKTYTFTIDRAPVISALDGGANAVEDDGISSTSVTVAVSGASSEPTATKDDGEYAYPVDGVFTEDGVYVVTATDGGKTTTFTFTIDATLPVLGAVLTVDGVTAVTEASLVTEAQGVTLSLTEANLFEISVTKDDAAYRKYPLVGEDDPLLLWDGTLPLTLTENGVYVIRIIDKAGNEVELSFTIDIE